MHQQGSLELCAHGIKQLLLIKGIHNLSPKKSKCIHNCTSDSWKWKHADENRAGQKDITVLLELPSPGNYHGFIGTSLAESSNIFYSMLW